MATIYIGRFAPKDPNDVEPKNFDAAGKLAEIGNPTVLGCTVFVDPTKGSADGLLIITNVVFDAMTKRISFVWSGGTPGATYPVTCRLSLGPNWQLDQSATVLIGDK